VWAPDGRSIAYITRSDADGGHIWRVPANGGRPQQLTRVPAPYRQLAWSPDGARIVALRSATRRPGGMSGGGPAEFIWIPATGGEATLIAPAAGRSSPHFTNDPDRIWAHS